MKSLRRGFIRGLAALVLGAGVIAAGIYALKNKEVIYSAPPAVESFQPVPDYYVQRSARMQFESVRQVGKNKYLGEMGNKGYLLEINPQDANVTLHFMYKGEGVEGN